MLTGKRANMDNAAEAQYDSQVTRNLRTLSTKRYQRMTRACETCGKDIPAARLEAVPDTRWCVEHAEPHVVPTRARIVVMHGLGRAGDKPDLPRGHPASRKHRKRR